MIKFIEALLVTLGAIVLVGLLALNAAYPISLMWDWFVTPLGVGSIGVAKAAGFVLLLRCLFIKTNNPKEPENPREAVIGVLGALISPWLLLFVASFFA